jgi:hypothetical protein
MDSVYQLLPHCIPPELQTLIHLYAGTCTPSCKNIKLYMEYIKSTRFNIINNTLWSSQITWETPKYIRRWVENGELTTPELDLKVAYFVLKREQFLANWLDVITYEYISTLEWFQMEIDRINKDLSTRLHNSTCQNV